MATTEENKRAQRQAEDPGLGEDEEGIVGVIFSLQLHTVPVPMLAKSLIRA